MTTIAIAGCAHIHMPNFAKKLAERAQARGDVRVARVWDPDAGRARNYAGQLGAAVADDVADVWKDQQIEAVVICSETSLHEALVMPAAANGKHLFVEKPLGMGATDAWRMARAIEKAGVIFQTGYFQRSVPIHLFLRDEIRKGSFGRVTRLRASMCHAGSFNGWFDTDYRWMADLEAAGCGAFGDLGTHMLDLMMWMLNDEVEMATAALAGAVSGKFGDCDEYGEGLVRFAGGAIGNLAGSWVDFAHPVSLIVTGTEGHAYVANRELFFRSDKVPGADGKTPWKALPEAWPHAFDLFLDAVTNQPHAPLVTPREAATRSAVMEALYKGAATGKWMKPKMPRLAK